MMTSMATTAIMMSLGTPTSLLVIRFTHHTKHNGNAEAWPQEHPFRCDASTKCVESLAYVAGEDPDDSSPDLGSSRSSSTPLRSTALTATMIEETDIRSADHSGLSMMP